MERMRRAEMKRQYEMVAKAALVNNIKVKIFMMKKKYFIEEKKMFFFFLGIKKT